MPGATSSRKQRNQTHRLSVSISAEQYAELVEMARQNKVSVAWVIREAIERLLHDELPLLHTGVNNG